MNTIFVDSSAWIELAAHNSPRHATATEIYLELLTSGKLCTSNYVLVETYTRLAYDISHRAAIQFREMITAAEKLNRLGIIWANRATDDAAWKIFEKYADQDFSFVDCASFALMRENKIARAFAFDDDFRIMGFDVKP